MVYVSLSSCFTIKYILFARIEANQIIFIIETTLDDS